MRSRAQLAAALDRRAGQATATPPAATVTRTNQQTTVETEEAIQKKRQRKAFQDLEDTANALSADVAFALALEVDDLRTQKAEFRQGMQRAFMRVLQAATQNPKQVVVFNEAVPGFTLMLFKKNAEPFEGEGTPVWSIDAHDDDSASPEAQATAVLSQQFFQRTRNRVLSVETPDALFVFFPVADLKKNLKEMGFYLVD